MRQKIELAAALLVLALLIFISRSISVYVAGSQVKSKNEKVVLDAGHGGIDPGKVGVNDVEEKEINLAIAKKVKALLEGEGIEVVMTREDDEMLGGQDGTSTKVADMKARVAMINEEAPALAVSIHQNSYHQEGVKGPQVFYYTHSDEGRKAGEIMQEALNTLDTDSSHKAKANDAYYLLKRTEVPAVIAECGFLSNWEEAELLSGEEYQQEVAQAIVSGIKAYMEK